MFGIMDETGKCWASEGKSYKMKVEEYRYSMQHPHIAVPKDYINYP